METAPGSARPTLLDPSAPSASDRSAATAPDTSVPGFPDVTSPDPAPAGRGGSGRTGPGADLPVVDAAIEPAAASEAPTAGARIVVGLGRMGSGIAAALVRAGHRVLGVDPAPVPTPEGVVRTSLPLALTEAQVLVLSLPGTEQVDHLLPELEHAPAPVLVIDASTCPPADTRRRAEWLAGHGHVLVDAPVSGGPLGAAEGAATVLLGCPERHLAAAREALEPLAARVIHVGDVGSGHTAELMTTLLRGIRLAAAQSLHRTAAASGIDPGRMLEAIDAASGRDAATAGDLPREALPVSASGVPVGPMARDMDLAAAMTAELGASSPVVEAARRMWQELARGLDPETDAGTMATGW